MTSHQYGDQHRLCVAWFLRKTIRSYILTFRSLLLSVYVSVSLFLCVSFCVLVRTSHKMLARCNSATDCILLAKKSAQGSWCDAFSAVAFNCRQPCFLQTPLSLTSYYRSTASSLIATVVIAVHMRWVCMFIMKRLNFALPWMFISCAICSHVITQ